MTLISQFHYYFDFTLKKCIKKYFLLLKVFKIEVNSLINT
jgi:hypothetical protein